MSRDTGRITRSLMQGDLAETPLADLLGFLQQIRRTGQLMVERARPRQAAAVFVREGRPYHAQCPPEVGERAIYVLLTWPDGRFAFLPEAHAEETTVEDDLPAILLEGMRRRDELEHQLAGLPARDAVLHRVLDAELTATVRLGLREWRLAQLVDGVRTIEDLLRLSFGGPEETAAALQVLITAGVVAERPDRSFLARMVLRAGVAGGLARPSLAARHLIELCDGTRTLAEVVASMAVPEQQALDEAALLLRAGVLRASAGEELVHRHLL